MLFYLNCRRKKIICLISVLFVLSAAIGDDSYVPIIENYDIFLCDILDSYFPLEGKILIDWKCSQSQSVTKICDGSRSYWFGIKCEYGHVVEV